MPGAWSAKAGRGGRRQPVRRVEHPRAIGEQPRVQCIGVRDLPGTAVACAQWQARTGLPHGELAHSGG
jgi:hypothetical protein